MKIYNEGFDERSLEEIETAIMEDEIEKGIYIFNAPIASATD